MRNEAGTIESPFQNSTLYETYLDLLQQYISAKDESGVISVKGSEDRGIETYYEIFGDRERLSAGVKFLGPDGCTLCYQVDCHPNQQTEPLVAAHSLNNVIPICGENLKWYIYTIPPELAGPLGISLIKNYGCSITQAMAIALGTQVTLAVSASHGGAEYHNWRADGFNPKEGIHDKLFKVFSSDYVYENYSI